MAPKKSVQKKTSAPRGSDTPSVAPSILATEQPSEADNLAKMSGIDIVHQQMDDEEEMSCAGPPTLKKQKVSASSSVARSITEPSAVSGGGDLAAGGDDDAIMTEVAVPPLGQASQPETEEIDEELRNLQQYAGVGSDTDEESQEGTLAGHKGKIIAIQANAFEAEGLFSLTWNVQYKAGPDQEYRSPIQAILIKQKPFDHSIFPLPLEVLYDGAFHLGIINNHA